MSAVAEERSGGLGLIRRRTRQRRAETFDRPRFLWIFTILMLVFLFVPVLVVILYSFNGQPSLVVMRGFSTQWYHEAITSGTWRGSLEVSIEIALVTMAACAVGGTLLAFGLDRANRHLARASESMLVLRLVSPETATAVASLLLFTQLGLTLSSETIVIAHIAVCLPFVAIVVRSRLALVNPELEDSAMDLGATRLRAIWLVVMPLLWPTLAAASMLCFVLSFDDFITSLFTSGVGTPPLPVRIYSMLRTGVTPVVNAIGVVMMLIAGGALIVALSMMRVGRSRSSLS